MEVAYTKDTQLGSIVSFDPKLSASEQQAPYTLLGNIDPTLQLKVIDQLDGASYIAIDSMNFWIQSQKDSLLKAIQKSNIVFLNDTEIRQLTQETSLVKAANILQSKGPDYIIIKKGEHGVLAVGKNFTFSTSAYLTENVKDPTGAGDSFAGGFLSYLHSRTKQQGKQIPNNDIVKQAIVWGTAVASYCVEDFSVTKLINISKKDVFKRCQELHQLIYFDSQQIMY